MATSFPEAARRMYTDAESLYSGGRLGSADHLFGLACECALKAILSGTGVIKSDPPEKAFKVHINKLWDAYSAHQSGRAPILGCANPFADWTVDQRYESDVTFTSERVEPHREGARKGLEAFERAEMGGLL